MYTKKVFVCIVFQKYSFFLFNQGIPIRDIQFVMSSSVNTKARDNCAFKVQIEAIGFNTKLYR